ncbi:hypothetical protein [Arcanobacterium haemolyticum]|uniref:hypothetical protein n=1 Tax=Arcanobacterium haemolyticum TaxID=28264 RepID=UPI0005A0AA4B|nr:hypothetical protein [Arcanobacterium haemolyticum]SPT75573.1 Uncharacterised protein [Arcanobacterium haemolyticum]SQH28327.1 Uncharacterised protein [Arcanobacterium haemolyticum]
MEIYKLPPKPVALKLTRVAAYVRVSRESERLTQSFSAQVSYYTTSSAQHQAGSTPEYILTMPRRVPALRGVTSSTK